MQNLEKKILKKFILLQNFIIKMDHLQTQHIILIKESKHFMKYGLQCLDKVSIKI